MPKPIVARGVKAGSQILSRDAITSSVVVGGKAPLSYYSTINGHIRVKSAQGMAILHKHFHEWTDPHAEGRVKLRDLRVDFSGYYRNLGRRLEPCLSELRWLSELADVNVKEETSDGFEAELHYELLE